MKNNSQRVVLIVYVIVSDESRRVYERLATKKKVLFW